MLRYLIIMAGLLVMTGCSELKVIGNAALRELKADGINVEVASYSYHQKLAARDKGTETVMAWAEKGVVPPVETKAVSKKIRTAKANKVRGLWETSKL